MANKAKKAEVVTQEYSETLDLFRSVHGYGAEEMSNIIYFWDILPKYSLSRKDQDSIRTKDGFLHELEIDTDEKIGDKYFDCRIEVKAGRATTKDGQKLSFYPSEREELVESVLRKIFEENCYGIYDISKQSAWVYFSINGIRKRLSKDNHGYKVHHIHEALEVMSSAVVTVIKDGEIVCAETIISGLRKVTSEKLSGIGDATWKCRLPSLLTDAMEKGNYGQRNYERFMKYNAPLPRWLDTRLNIRFNNANNDNSYTISFNTIKAESKYLDSGDARNQRLKLDRAVESLEKSGVIKSGSHKKVIMDGRRITNVIYTVKPTPAFISEKKRDNARRAKMFEEMQKAEDKKKIQSKLEALKNLP